MADTIQKYEQLDTAFRHRNFKPLYFVYGEEQFLSDTLQATLIEHALAPHERDFNLDVVYGAEADVQSVLALCAQYPLMAERRVVVVRDFEKLNQNAKFTAYAKSPNPSTLVFLMCRSKPNLAANPYRALKKHAESAFFKPLYERQMPGWIQKRVQALGRRIKPDAVQMLAALTGANLRTAALEIDKLIAYAGDRQTLTREDVLDVGGHARNYNVFELQKAIGTARFNDAMRIMERMLQGASNRRGEALMMISVLTGYFVKLRKLTVCQARRIPEQAMAARIGVPMFFIKEYTASLRHYPPAELERAFGALLSADYALKGGQKYDEVLILALMLRRLMP